jgi:hypothetical protein
LDDSPTLNEDQIGDLRAHLGRVFAPEACAKATDRVVALANHCAAWNQAEHDAGRMRLYRERMKLAKALAQVQVLLREPEDMPPSAHIEREDFLAQVSVVEIAARWEAEYSHPRGLPISMDEVAEGARARRQPGKPVHEGRDRLILEIRRLYPEGEPRRHFYETIEMVLAFIGHGREDLRGLIEGALRRDRDRVERIRRRHPELKID